MQASLHEELRDQRIAFLLFRHSVKKAANSIVARCPLQMINAGKSSRDRARQPQRIQDYFCMTKLRIREGSRRVLQCFVVVLG